jgi:hypothetical protein
VELILDINISVRAHIELNEYLKRLEIGAENKKLGCFVYTHSQLNINREILSKINSMCFGR